MNDDDIRKFHLTGISGTDIGAILGLNPYKSPMDVYASKLVDDRGVPLMPAVEDNEKMEWGRLLEPVVAKHYVDNHPDDVAGIQKGEAVRHPHRPWQIGTPDYIVQGPCPRFKGDTKLLLEIKTSGAVAKQFWEDGPPAQHVAQIMWYLSLIGLEVGDIAVLFGGQEYKEYRLTANPAHQSYLLEVAENFWKKNVLAHVPPAADASESTRKTLQLLYPKDVEPLVEADMYIETAAMNLGGVKKTLAQMEAKKLLFENTIKAFIGNAGGVQGQFGRITWKKDKDGSVTDWRAVAESLEHELEFRAGERGKEFIRKTKEVFTVPKAGTRRFLEKFKDEEE